MKNDIIASKIEKVHYNDMKNISHNVLILWRKEKLLESLYDYCDKTGESQQSHLIVEKTERSAR